MSGEPGGDELTGRTAGGDSKARAPAQGGAGMGLGYTLYHVVWLGWDISHLGSPESLFFAAMMLWAVWRGVRSWRRRHRWHRMT